eukprot:scaffold152327_cov27-Tisochrysis_lutea.AAC.2
MATKNPRSAEERVWMSVASRCLCVASVSDMPGLTHAWLYQTCMGRSMYNLKHAWVVSDMHGLKQVGVIVSARVPVRGRVPASGRMEGCQQGGEFHKGE